MTTLSPFCLPPAPRLHAFLPSSRHCTMELVACPVSFLPLCSVSLSVLLRARLLPSDRCSAAPINSLRRRALPRLFRPDKVRSTPPRVEFTETLPRDKGPSAILRRMKNQARNSLPRVRPRTPAPACSCLCSFSPRPVSLRRRRCLNGIAAARSLSFLPSFLLSSPSGMAALLFVVSAVSRLPLAARRRWSGINSCCLRRCA